MTGDGILDRIDCNYNVVVRPGLGGGTFGEPIYSDAPGAYTLGLADFDGDGRLDVFTLNYPAGREYGWGSVLWGGGGGTFHYLGENYDFPYGTPLSIGFGDLFGSGRTDVVVGLEWGEYNYIYAVLRNNLDWGSPKPSLTIRDTTVTEGNAGAVSATFTVRLSAASSEAVTVAYATSNGTATAGSDYQATSGTLTFTPGETSKTITVLVNGDRLGEPNETFVVNLSSPTNAIIADGQGTGTILDDEPRIRITDVSKSEGRKGTTTLFTFTVTLSAAYDQPVIMSFRTVNGTARTSDNDYVARTGTLTFAPGETTRTVTIEVKGDSKREASEYFYLDLFNNSTNSLFAKSRGVGTILNDD